MEQVQRLRVAMQEYDNDRWRIISGKVGNGFSASACKEKATELEDEDGIENIAPAQEASEEPPKTDGS